MKRVIISVLFLVFIVGNISFVKGGDPLESFQANQVYQYDLDGDGILDTINYVVDRVNNPVLHINQERYTLYHIDPQLYMLDYKIVNLDTSDGYREIAIGFAFPPYDDGIRFYRYSQNEVHFIGEIIGNLHDIGSSIVINGDGTIINTIHSRLVQGASYQIHYGLIEDNTLVQTSRPDIYYYQKHLQKNLKGNTKFYKSYHSSEFRTFDSDVEATFLGESNGWVWVDVEGDTYWLKGCIFYNYEVLLKTYDEIYLNEGLLGSINYFFANYYLFTIEEREIFANQICLEVVERSNEYVIVNSISAESIPAPPVLEFVNSLYAGIYDGEANILKVSSLDEATKEIIAKIAKDDVFNVVKKYYVVEDVIEDAGFTVATHPEVFMKLKTAFDVVFIEEYGRYKDQSGEPIESLNMIGTPNDLISASDTSWTSFAPVYPEVYVETVDRLQLLRGAWKAHAYLPVIIEGLSEENF